MKEIVIKIKIDEQTDELVVANRLKEWLIDNFLDGAKAEVEVQSKR
jgi:hypothetical protein